MKERNDDSYELHVKYVHGLNGVSEEALIIERRGEAIVVFGPGGKKEGEYRRARTEPVIRIHARHLGGIDQVRGNRRKVAIIGHLGRPLHTMMTVRGVWHFPARVEKDNSLRFRVTHIDGQALERPVTFHGDLVHEWSRASRKQSKTKRSEGDTWEMLAYESGHFDNIPAGWHEALGWQIEGRMFGGFVVELHGAIVRVESASQPGK